MNIDVDSMSWWMLLIHKIVTGIGVAWLTLDRIWERFWKVEEFLEKRVGTRRHTDMDLRQIEQLPGLIADLLKTFGDIKVVAGKLTTDPDAIKVIDDVTALEAKVKTIFNA